jgi:hypothetical protein
VVTKLSEPILYRTRRLQELWNELKIEENVWILRITELYSKRSKCKYHINLLKEKLLEKESNQFILTAELVNALLNPDEAPDGGLLEYEPYLYDKFHQDEIAKKRLKKKNTLNEVILYFYNFSFFFLFLLFLFFFSCQSNQFGQTNISL